jgi:hypothetical protein
MMAGDARGKVEAASTPSSKASFVLCAVYLDEVGPVHVAGGGGDYGVMLPCIPPWMHSPFTAPATAAGRIVLSHEN